jgi:hypothetical protein
MEFLKYLESFRGEIGIVVGTFIGTITTIIIKNLGTLKFFINEVELKYKKLVNEMYQSYEETTNYKDADKCDFSADIDIYNSSENPKIIRELNVVIINKQKITKSFKPYDSNTRKRTNSGLVITDKIGGINLPPKIMTKILIDSDIFSDEKIPNLKGSKLYLQYKNEKNKKRKRLLMKL